MTFSGSFGGRENVAFSLAKLMSSSMQSSVLYLILETRADQGHRNDLLSRLEQSKIRHRIFYLDRRFSWNIANEIAAALQEDGAQIVHCHCYKSGVYAVLIKHLKGLKGMIVAFTLHGLQVPFSLNALVLHLLNFLAIATVDSIIGCSGEIVSRYARIPFLNRRVAIIQNGLVTDTANIKKYTEMKHYIREKLAGRFGLDKNALWIGNVGRLTNQKNHVLFIDAILSMKEDFRRMLNVNFLIIGDGELKDKLTRMTREVSIDDVVFFTGHVSDMNEIYAALDIQVLSSDWEGTPMCILEGMSFGLPIIASAVGGTPDLIEHEETGLLFKKRNKEQLRRCMIDLITNERKRRSLGEKAQEHLFQAFTAGVWADRHIGHYVKLLSRKRGAACAAD